MTKIELEFDYEFEHETAVQLVGEIMHFMQRQDCQPDFPLISQIVEPIKDKIIENIQKENFNND